MKKRRFLTEHYEFRWKNDDSSQNITNSKMKTPIPHRTLRIPNEQKRRFLTEHYEFLRKSYDSSQNITNS